MKKVLIFTAAVALVLGMAFVASSAFATPYEKGSAPQIDKEKQDATAAPASCASEKSASCPMKDKKDASCPMTKDKKDSGCCAVKTKDKPAK